MILDPLMIVALTLEAVVGAGLFVMFLRAGKLERERLESIDSFDIGVKTVERELGVQFPGRRSGGGSQSAYGKIGDMTIAIVLETRVEFAPQRVNELAVQANELVVTLDGGRIPKEISFTAEPGLLDDVLTGDPAFDGAVEISGEPSLVLALLDEPLRRKVATFVVGDRGSLQRGRIQCRAPLEGLTIQIPTVVRATLEMADALSSAAKGGVCPRLAGNATRDPEPGVRLQNLEMLQEKFLASREAREASRAALSDASPWMRLAGARFLRAEVETLTALARDGEAPDHASEEAVALLAARLSPERAGPLLIEVVESRAGDTRRQAVVELGRLKHGPALEPRVRVLEQADPRTAAAAATALGALRDARAEPHLADALKSAVSEVRLAAVQSLGSLGSVKSVALLADLVETRGLDTATRAAARGAIASIQARLVGAEAGQLSVAAAESETGRLSLAGSTGPGDLTLADDVAKPPRTPGS